MTVKIYARFYVSGKDYSIFTERISTIYLIIENGMIKIKCPGYLASMIINSKPDRVELVFRELDENGSLIEGETIESFLYLNELRSRSLIGMDIIF